jgi:hypothetical protein
MSTWTTGDARLVAALVDAIEHPRHPLEGGHGEELIPAVVDEAHPALLADLLRGLLVVVDPV